MNGAAAVALVTLIALLAPATTRAGDAADRVAIVRSVLGALEADPRQRVAYPCVSPRLIGSAFGDFVATPPRELARQRYLAAHPELRLPFDPYALGLDDVGRPSRSYRIPDRRVTPALDDELHAAALPLVHQPEQGGGPREIEPAWVHAPLKLYRETGKPDIARRCGDVPIFLSQPTISGGFAFVQSSRECGAGCGFEEMFALRRAGAGWRIVARWVTVDKAGYPNGKPF